MGFFDLFRRGQKVEEADSLSDAIGKSGKYERDGDAIEIAPSKGGDDSYDSDDFPDDLD